MPLQVHGNWSIAPVMGSGVVSLGVHPLTTFGFGASGDRNFGSRTASIWNSVTGSVPSLMTARRYVSGLPIDTPRVVALVLPSSKSSGVRVTGMGVAANAGAAPPARIAAASNRVI